MRVSTAMTRNSDTIMDGKFALKYNPSDQPDSYDSGVIRCIILRYALLFHYVHVCFVVKV